MTMYAMTILRSWRQRRRSPSIDICLNPGKMTQSRLRQEEWTKEKERQRENRDI